MSQQFAMLLTQFADERDGVLAAVRGLVEYTAHRFADQPGAADADTAHRLELIAHRLYGIQQDLQATATRLNAPPPPPTAVPASPAAKAATRQPR